ncbi:hypothetical protein D3C77_563570 [compost metagenome]
MAVHRIAAQADQLAGDMAARHGNHFHRQREAAEYRHALAGVGDAHERLGHRGDDFFPGQRGAAALDQFQAVIGFVGAVDVELQFADRIQVVDRNAMVFQALGGGFRAGHGAVEVLLVTGQGIDEEVGGGAGPHADDAGALQVREDVVDGGLGHGLLELVLIHDGFHG